MGSISSENLSLETIIFDEKDFNTNETNIDTSFDRLLRYKWTEALDKNVFRYKVTENSLLSKVLEGKYKMLAQLNEERAVMRRKPQDMTAIQMPFDGQKFNFTRIKAEECLFRIKSLDGLTEGTVIINQSPIEFCNSLLVSQLEECKPQVLTAEALRLAICLVALSGRQSLKLGFNSLGAMASVNHQHFHLYYYNFELVIDSLPISDNRLRGWPTDSFVFEIKTICFKRIDSVVEQIIKLVDYCIQESQNIAHNVFISRKGFTIRVYFWPRDPVFGAKNDLEINPAFCEFTGFFMCKTRQMFDEFNEEICVKLLSSVTTRCDELKHLLQY